MFVVLSSFFFLHEKDDRKFILMEQHLKVGNRMDKYASPEEYDDGVITDI